MNKASFSEDYAVYAETLKQSQTEKDSAQYRDMLDIELNPDSVSLEVAGPCNT